jgi:hypothetical protein
VADRRRESLRPGPVLARLYKLASFVLFLVFIVVLVTPGLSFRALGAWLDWALKGAP